jgi:hypothetical protein
MYENRSTEQQLPYLAGLFDGEGSFSIQMRIIISKKGKQTVNFIPKMTMTLLYGNEVLDELVEGLGGTVYPYKDGYRRWSLGTREELQVAAHRLLPYLRIKRQVAEQFLAALAIFPTSRKAHCKGERSWTLEMTLKVARIALALNPPKAKKSQKTVEYLKLLEAAYEGVA